MSKNRPMPGRQPGLLAGQAHLACLIQTQAGSLCHGFEMRKNALDLEHFLLLHARSSAAVNSSAEATIVSAKNRGREVPSSRTRVNRPPAHHGKGVTTVGGR